MQMQMQAGIQHHMQVGAVGFQQAFPGAMIPGQDAASNQSAAQQQIN